MSHCVLLSLTAKLVRHASKSTPARVSLLIFLVGIKESLILYKGKMATWKTSARQYLKITLIYLPPSSITALIPSSGTLGPHINSKVSLHLTLEEGKG